MTIKNIIGLTLIPMQKNSLVQKQIMSQVTDCFDQVKSRTNQAFGAILDQTAISNYQQFQLAICEAQHGDPKSFIKLVRKSAIDHEKSGARIWMLTSNFAQNYFKEIVKDSPLELVDLVSPVVEECQNKNYQTVLILGSEQIIGDGHYESGLAEKGISSVLPSYNEQETLNSILHEARKCAKLSENIQEKFGRFFKGLQKQQDVEAVVFANLGISQLFRTPIPKLDPVELQVNEAVNHLLLKNLLKI